MSNSAPNEYNIHAGELRERVTIRRRMADGSNGTAYVDFATVSAKIEPVTGGGGGQVLYPGSDTLITIRYLPGIDEKMIVVAGDATFHLNGINDVEYRHVKHVLYARSPVMPDAYKSGMAR